MSKCAVRAYTQGTNDLLLCSQMRLPQMFFDEHTSLVNLLLFRPLGVAGCRDSCRFLELMLERHQAGSCTRQACKQHAHRAPISQTTWA